MMMIMPMIWVDGRTNPCMTIDYCSAYRQLKAVARFDCCPSLRMPYAKSAQSSVFVAAAAVVTAAAA